MNGEADNADRYLPPGTRVWYDGREDGVVEHGIVVHCWFHPEVQGHDTYVAYFEGEWPEKTPPHRPGIVRMGAMFLNVVEDNQA